MLLGARDSKDIFGWMNQGLAVQAEEHAMLTLLRLKAYTDEGKDRRCLTAGKLTVKTGEKTSFTEEDGGNFYKSGSGPKKL